MGKTKKKSKKCIASNSYEKKKCDYDDIVMAIVKANSIIEETKKQEEKEQVSLEKEEWNKILGQKDYSNEKNKYKKWIGKLINNIHFIEILVFH